MYFSHLGGVFERKIKLNWLIQYGSQQKMYTVITVKTNLVTLACDFFLAVDLAVVLAAVLLLGPTVRSLNTTWA